MHIREESLEKFRAIWLKEYGEEEAYEAAVRLLTLFKAVYYGKNDAASE